MRTKDVHDTLVQEIQTNGGEENYSVKQSSVHSDYPPDILHDLFEDVYPVELAQGLKSLIAKKYFTLEELSKAIRIFPSSILIRLTALTQFLKILLVEEQLVRMGMRTTLCLDCYLLS